MNPILFFREIQQTDLSWGNMSNMWKCSRIKYSVSKDQPQQLTTFVTNSAKLSIRDAAKQKSEVL